MQKSGFLSFRCKRMYDFSFGVPGNQRQMYVADISNVELLGVLIRTKLPTLRWRKKMFRDIPSSHASPGISISPFIKETQWQLKKHLARFLERNWELIIISSLEKKKRFKQMLLSPLVFLFTIAIKTRHKQKNIARFRKWKLVKNSDTVCV